MAKQETLAVGDTVRLTAKHMRVTGQQTERMAPWKIQECGCGLCKLGNHVAVDEDSGFYDPAEPETRWRHVYRGNLKRSRF